MQFLFNRHEKKTGQELLSHLTGEGAEARGDEQ